MPVVLQEVAAADLYRREASLLVLGAVANGVRDAIAPTHVLEILTLLQNATHTHQPALLRVMGCWSLVRYLDLWCHDAPPEAQEERVVMSAQNKSSASDTNGCVENITATTLTTSTRTEREIDRAIECLVGCVLDKNAVLQRSAASALSEIMEELPIYFVSIYLPLIVHH